MAICISGGTRGLTHDRIDRHTEARDRPVRSCAAPSRETQRPMSQTSTCLIARNMWAEPENAYVPPGTGFMHPRWGIGSCAVDRHVYRPRHASKRTRLWDLRGHWFPETRPEPEVSWLLFSGRARREGRCAGGGGGLLSTLPGPGFRMDAHGQLYRSGRRTRGPRLRLLRRLGAVRLGRTRRRAPGPTLPHLPSQEARMIALHRPFGPETACACAAHVPEAFRSPFWAFSQTPRAEFVSVPQNKSTMPGTGSVRKSPRGSFTAWVPGRSRSTARFAGQISVCHPPHFPERRRSAGSSSLRASRGAGYAFRGCAACT